MLTPTRAFRFCARGFTLVELAIVMTIIALLTGGVLKGNEMIQRARVQSLIKQMDSVRVGISAFRDKFSQFPGDMANATQRIQNCTPTVFCRNGNADGNIGFGGPSPLDISYTTSGVNAQESVQAWKHLALADFLQPNIRVSADPDNADDLAFGVSHPATAFTGGMHIVWFNAGAVAIGGINPGRQHQMYFRPTVTGRLGANNGYQFTGSMFISPLWLQYIDTKTDDGRFTTGIIQGFCFDPANPGAVLATPDMTSRSNDCTMLAQLL